MVNYGNGKIYRLVCNVTGLEYIGSTVSPLSVRKAEHVSDYRRWQKGKKNFITSMKVMEHGDFDIFLVEDYPCENIEQLKARERYWIEASDKRVNKNLPCRSAVEYRCDNKEYKAEYNKQYREENKERLAEQKKRYYTENREHIVEWKKESVYCGCGSTYTKCHKSRHCKSIKHQNWLKEQNITEEV